MRGKPLPAWAAEVGAASFATLALNFVLAHPAVTCPIPATSSAAHLGDNVCAGEGAPLDARQREEVAALFA